jgi:hypothetical protein
MRAASAVAGTGLTLQPRTSTIIVNPAPAFLVGPAVENVQWSGPRLKAFFVTCFYAGLRPEEAVELRRANITLPATDTEWARCTSKDLLTTSARLGPTIGRTANTAASNTAKPTPNASSRSARASWQSCAHT